MIPVPVAAPAARHDASAASGALMAWLGGLLLFGAFIGAVTWYVVIAPTSFVTFDSSPGYARLDASAGQTYVVAAEGPGALGQVLPPPVLISVRAIGGQPVTVVEGAEPGEELTGPTYDLLGRQGRVLATFTPSSDGSYLVSSSPLGGIADEEGYAPVPPARYAVGREVGVTWWGSWGGLVVLAGVPLVLGAWLTAIAVRDRRRRRPAARDASATVGPGFGPAGGSGWVGG